MAMMADGLLARWRGLPKTYTQVTRKPPQLSIRLGHSSPRAALIDQHATRDRDEAIAAAMGEVFATARRKGTPKGRSGTQRARKRGKAS